MPSDRVRLISVDMLRPRTTDHGPRTTDRVSRWDTFAPVRRVLAVARNVPATTRLLDALSLLRGDRRVEIRFTLTRSEAFHPGDADVLTALGAQPIPWEEAAAQPFDLAVAASANGPLHELRAPLLLIPHGAGQHKLVDPADPARGVHGIAREQLIAGGRVVPAAVLLTGAEPLALLRRDCPEAVPYARIGGDLSLQQLAGAYADRERHRRALGLGAGQRLVTVSSTWGPASLLGRTPVLPDRLLADLPRDEYRVAAVLHPNVVARHSMYQIRAWYADALDAGLILVPPSAGWQAVLLSTDCLIGDHGSVSFYAAALDVPVLLASTGDGEVPPSGPSARLAEACPRFNTRESPRLQIEQALEKFEPGVLPALTEPSVSSDVDAAGVYREVLYRMLRLDPPVRKRALPPPVAPDVDVRAVRTHVVYADEPVPGLVELRRFPASTMEHAVDARGPGRHLAAEAGEPDARLRRGAEVIADDGAATDPTGAATALLDRYPGCLVAVAAGAGGHAAGMYAAATRGGGAYTLSTAERCEPVLLASALRVYAARGERPPERLAVRVAGRVTAVGVASA